MSEETKSMARNGKNFDSKSRPRFKNGKNFKSGRKGGNRFLSNAKGFAKKGNFGRGTTVDEEDFKYYFGILDIIQKQSAEADERVTMANNVLEQAKGKEVHLASNQVVSQTLEALVGFADAEYLEKFFEVFGENFRPICSDPFASHVLQKLIQIAFLRAVAKDKIEDNQNDEENEPQAKRHKSEYVTDLAYNLVTEFSEEHRTTCSEFVQRASKFLLNNLEDFVWDSCGTHLIRTCVMCLAGVYLPKVQVGKGKQLAKADHIKGSKAGHHKGEFQVTKSIFRVPSEWAELMKEFPSRLDMWPQFSELPYKEQSSALIGVICVALSYVDKSTLKHLGKKLLNQSFINVEVPEHKVMDNKPRKPQDMQKSDKSNGNEGNSSNEGEDEDNKDDGKNDEDLPSVFKSESSVHLLETLMSVAGPKLLSEIYKTLFVGRLLDLAKGQKTNFCVQKLLNYIKDKEIFETIFDDLIKHTEEFIKIGNCGVVGALSGACLRLNTKQAAFITALQAALHCSASSGSENSKSFFACLLKMKPFEVLPYDKSHYVMLHGSLIIQDILQYNKPIFLVNCIIETPPKDLVLTFQLPNGSHIADVFFKSKFIGEKSREKLIKQLDGFYIDLAVTRCGSRVLEKIFEAANEVQKIKIAKELTSKENKLKATMFGRIIFNVLRLETFKLSQDQWKASWTAKGNKTDEIMDAVNKKKKRKTSS